MDSYSIFTTDFAFLQVCASLDELMPYIRRFVKNRKKADILKNGEKIGWIGEDLTQRLGWGYFVEEDK